MKKLLLTALLLTAPAMAEEVVIYGNSGNKFTLHASTVHQKIDKTGKQVIGYWSASYLDAKIHRMKIAVTGCDSGQGSLILTASDGSVTKPMFWVYDGQAVYDGVAVAQCASYYANLKNF